MKKVHLQKQGIRAFGIAESFQRGCIHSALAGVVMRRDLIIDGIVLGKASIEGSDATTAILSMYRSLNRNDINCVILDGLIISMYNIIDADYLAKTLGIPIIAVTFNKSSGLDEIIHNRFEDSKERIRKYRALGEREQVSLKTGKDLFVRFWKIERAGAISILNSFTLQGRVPEPIRVAKLCARACSHALK